MSNTYPTNDRGELRCSMSNTDPTNDRGEFRCSMSNTDPTKTGVNSGAR